MQVYEVQHELNQITVQRRSLSFDEAVAVWLMHLEGHKQHLIAARFGTNAGRVADVLTEKKHAGAKAKAISLRAS